MQIEKKALYNSLRMNWLRDPSVETQSWQVEDYRAMPVQQLFDRLRLLELCLDRVSFLALAENVDTPEELADDLLAESDFDAVKQDQVYLLVFELWRRLVPEKQSLSIFCDELDHQIDLYDRKLADGAESIQDVLGRFAVILDENTDEGEEPHNIFATISKGCAHDVEVFLYDFIADQIDNKNDSYALELLEDFTPYVQNEKWFDLLKMRLISFSDMSEAETLIKKISQGIIAQPDLEYNLEVLSVLVQVDAPADVFRFFLAHSLSIIASEEDFQDILSLSADYFHFQDQDQKELAVQKILDSRSQIPLNRSIDPNDRNISELLNFFS